MKNIQAKILLFVGTIILLGACSAVKRVPSESKLLTGSSIITNNKLITDTAINSFIIQRPNQKVLGLPLALHFYNIGNPELLKSYNKWLKDPKSGKKPMGKFRRGFNNWFLKNGNSPVIIDKTKTKKTAKNLQQYYFTQGYFDATVSVKNISTGKKRAVLKYVVNTNQFYTIATFRIQIRSPYLDSIYTLNKSASFIKTGDTFNTTNFEREENRLINLFRNSGVAHFTKSIIKFEVDTSKVTHTASVVLTIPNRVITDASGTPQFINFVPQKVKKINVITDYDFSKKGELFKDSLQLKNINFYSFSTLKYNPKILIDAVAIMPNGLYKEDEKNKTRRYFNNLKNFNVAINYTENQDNTLTADILLNPLKKYSLGTDIEVTHSNVKPFGLTSKISFTNRNVFKGAENLELSFQGSFLNSAKDASTNSNFFDAYEYGVNLSLYLPRILFPFKIKKIIPRYMQPVTLIKVGTSLQKNIGLDRQNFTGILNYRWQSSSKVSHNLELLNVQYIRNFKTDNYFNIFKSEFDKLNQVSQIFNGFALEQNDLKILQFINTVLTDGSFGTTNPVDLLTVQNVNERRSILIENVLVPAIGYTFTYQNKENLSDNNFSFLRANILSSGLLTSAFTKKSSAETQKTIFNLPVAQFIKTQLEYKKYWGLDQNTLVFRSFVGLALAYGNSTTIPFSRSYFAGGSNEIRAWKAYILGPGATKSDLEFNVGNFKIVGNLEYRFKILNSFNGALFVDAGNIWNITSNNTFVDNATKFKGLASLKDVAVGSGFGVRYDFNFLVFRFDVGLKTYEPYLTQQKKWFTNFNFANAVYNIGINYPF
ncbi:MAG: BamA/TamA family outer membrane protein [Flavobacteriaceae bacterium]|nr:BamA/TamA family outer membrane protein [Flavobacteriaceae bacterium]